MKKWTLWSNKNHTPICVGRWHKTLYSTWRIYSIYNTRSPPVRAEPAAKLSFLHFESKITFFVTISFPPLHVKSPIFFSFVQLQFPNFFSVYDSQSKNLPKKHEYDYFEVSSLHTHVFIRFYGNQMANPPEIC